MKSFQRDRSLPNPAAEPTISVIRAGQILGMSRNAAYAAAKDGRFPTVPISRSRVVVLTADFLEKYRLHRPPRPSVAAARPAVRALSPGRIHAQWQLNPSGAGRLILSSAAWPPLRAVERGEVARAVADAAEAAIGVALGRPGRAS